MLSKCMLVAGTLSALQGVSARVAKLPEGLNATQIVRDRVGEKLIGDQCHPIGTYVIGTNDLIPPCVSEQLVSWLCEHLAGVDVPKDAKNQPTADNWSAYKQCMINRPSSYWEDSQGCLACKREYNMLSQERHDLFKKNTKQAWETFNNDKNVKATLWNGYVAPLFGDWAEYLALPDTDGTKRPDVPINKYYPNAPIPQNIGPFTLGNETFTPPGTGQQTNMNLADTTVQIPGKVPEVIAAQVPINGEDNKPEGQTTTQTTTQTAGHKFTNITSTVAAPAAATPSPESVRQEYVVTFNHVLDVKISGEGFVFKYGCAKDEPRKLESDSNGRALTTEEREKLPLGPSVDISNTVSIEIFQSAALTTPQQPDAKCQALVDIMRQQLPDNAGPQLAIQAKIQGEFDLRIGITTGSRADGQQRQDSAPARLTQVQGQGQDSAPARQGQGQDSAPARQGQAQNSGPVSPVTPNKSHACKQR